MKETLEQELARLRAWRESLLAVEREWDEQKIAKMLGASPGQSCRAVINERVPKLLHELAVANEKIKTLAQTLCTVDAERHQLRAKVTDQAKELVAGLDMITAAHTNASIWKTDCAHWLRRGDEYASECGKLRATLSTLEAERDQLRSELEKLHGQRSCEFMDVEAAIGKGRLLGGWKTVCAEITQLRDRVSELDAKLYETECARVFAVGQIAALEADKARLTDALARIESEVSGALNNADPVDAPDILAHVGSIAKDAQHGACSN